MSRVQLSTKPIYQQLRDLLAERIAKGEWKPGAIIPNEGDLAREFGVSAGTMRKALSLLENEHLITRRQGRGTFVNDPVAEGLADRFCNIRGAEGKPMVGRVEAAEVRRLLPPPRKRSACRSSAAIRCGASGACASMATARSCTRRCRCQSRCFPT